MRPAERQLILYPMSLQVPSGPSSSGCYSQERAISGGQGKVWPKDRPNHLCLQPAHPGPARPQGLFPAEEQSSSCFFQPGGSEFWGAWFAPLPPCEHLALVLARGWGAEEKLLSWLWAKHYTARVSHILAASALGSQMISLPDHTP